MKMKKELSKPLYQQRKRFHTKKKNNENDTKKFNAKMNVTRRIILHVLF